MINASSARTVDLYMLTPQTYKLFLKNARKNNFLRDA